MFEVNWFPFLLLIVLGALLYVGASWVRHREHRSSTQKQSPERHFSAAVSTSENMRLQSADTAEAWNKLTRREKQVAHLAAHGKSDVEIASLLGISEKTVGNHLYRIFGKLEIRSRRELVYKLPHKNKADDFP